MPENRIDTLETTEKIIEGFFDFIRKNNLNLHYASFL